MSGLSSTHLGLSPYHPVRPHIPIFSPGRITMLMFFNTLTPSSALLNRELYIRIDGYSMGLTYSYETDKFRISILPFDGQLAGGVCFSSESLSSGLINFSKALSRDTAPIDVSDKAQQRIMDFKVEVREIRLTRPTPVNPELVFVFNVNVTTSRASIVDIIPSTNDNHC